VFVVYCEVAACVMGPAGHWFRGMRVLCVGWKHQQWERPRADVGLLGHNKKIPPKDMRVRLPVALRVLCTARSRVLLEKLTVSQLVKRFPAFYGSRTFIAAFTRARHVSLS
jgi:hypothetical protein